MLQKIGNKIAKQSFWEKKHLLILFSLLNLINIFLNCFFFFILLVMLGKDVITVRRDSGIKKL